MASLDMLPQNWRQKAVRVFDIDFALLGEGIWIDDDCPLQLSIVVVMGGEIFRLDQELSFLLLPALGYPGRLQLASLLAATVDLKTPRLN